MFDHVVTTNASVNCIFSDADGTVLYEEQITDSSTSLSAEGQRTVDAILAELNTTAAANHMSVSWSEYDIAGATADILVKAICRSSAK